MTEQHQEIMPEDDTIDVDVIDESRQAPRTGKGDKKADAKKEKTAPSNGKERTQPAANADLMYWAAPPCRLPM